MKVNTFLAGVQKGGTTTLHAYLSYHEQTAAGSGKELHFFDNETLDWNSPEYALYHQKFVNQDAKLYLDSTPIYTFWPPALKRIHQYNPDARLIILFRDPVARAYSHWNMEKSKNKESLEFSEAIRSGRDRLKKLPRLHDACRVFTYVERGFYGQQAARALRYFDKRQILFLLSEELFAYPEQTLRKVTDFLGIPPFREIPRLHANQGAYSRKELPQEDIAHLLQLYKEDIPVFRKLTGLDTGLWKYAGYL